MRQISHAFFGLVLGGLFCTNALADDSLGVLPPVPTPDGSELSNLSVDLGRLLFFDTRLSGDGSLSCATCHDPSFGWGDGLDLSRGYPGNVHWRNSPTVVNSGYLTKGWLWTGEAGALDKQAGGAMGAALIGNLNHLLAEERLRQIPVYVDRFDRAFGEAPSAARAFEAIADFERSLVSDDSPFDRFMRGDENAMSEGALRGKDLFEGKAGCIVCHNGPLATDQAFHNIGVPAHPSFKEEPLRQIALRERLRSKKVEDPEIFAELRDPGLYAVTKDRADLGKFRTAPLRYLIYTAPYMHNGTFSTLEEVVDFYNSGGGSDEDVWGAKSELLSPLDLSDGEKADLVAFLESMSGSEIFVEWPDAPPYETTD